MFSREAQRSVFGPKPTVDSMSIALTPEQQQQLPSTPTATGVPPEVLDPRTHQRYVLIPWEEYQTLRDDRDQAALRTAATRTLARRLVEGA